MPCMGLGYSMTPVQYEQNRFSFLAAFRQLLESFGTFQKLPRRVCGCIKCLNPATGMHIFLINMI